jgi:hypothetical protein
MKQRWIRSAVINPDTSEFETFDELVEVVLADEYNRLKRQLEKCRLQRNAQIVFPELKYTIEELDLEIEKVT